MWDVFISYAKEDGRLAAEIAEGLERAGHGTWYFERDSVPGRSHLEQSTEGIARSQACVLLASPASAASREVDTEVLTAYGESKHIVPILHGVAYQELLQLKPVWKTCFRAAAAIEVPPEGVSAIIRRVILGLMSLGCWPGALRATDYAPFAADSVLIDPITAIARIEGEIDVANVGRLSEYLLRLLGDNVARLVLDVSGVDYFDSSGLGLLVGLQKRLKERGGGVALVGLVPRVRRLFDVNSRPMCTTGRRLMGTTFS